MAAKRLPRPTVKVRNAEAIDNAKIVEASAPNGAGLLIGIHPTLDGEALYISPYRADRAVYLMIKSHTGDCAVFTRRDHNRRCDCGACLTYHAPSGEWRPTSRDLAVNAILTGPPQ